MFGQSSWNTTVGGCGRSRFNRMIPAMVYLIASITFSCPTLAHFWHLSLLYAKTGGTIICFVHFLSLVIAITSVVNSIFYDREISQLIEIFDRTVSHLQHFSKKRFTVNSFNFKRAYVKKCVIMFALCMLQFMIKILTEPMQFDRPMHIIIFTCIMTFYKNLAKAHVLFYIDLLRWCYKLNADQLTLNDDYYNLDVDLTDHNIKNKIKPTINVDEYIDNLRHCKYIHFKLWKISNLINSHFGWIMIFGILNNIIEALMAAFWIFLHLREANYRDFPRK